MQQIKVYNQQMQLTAYLENAYAIGYETPFNALWTASFSLPADDEKNAECLPMRYVEIFDNGERVDLFRIMPSSAKRSVDGSTITYQCEHVLGTLLDDVLFQFHTVGNLGVYTSDVVDYVLQAQTTGRWQRGNVAFDRQFEYTWENENLLAALYSIPKPFVEEYMWTWDTASYPWTINLVEPPVGAQAYIRYGVNMQGITKEVDPYDLCTRLYCLGYGEGVNQLTISEVNSGVPYLDADTQSEYGVIAKVWTDRRFISADTLKARGQAILDEVKSPRITYQVDAAELFALTGEPIDRFVSGAQVRMIDDELGIDTIMRVVNKRRPDVKADPGAVQLEIANRPINMAGSIAELADRQRINETYAQGATNVNVYDLVDNCDQTRPAVLRFWIPEESVKINKVILSYELEKFRGYSKAIEAAPAVSSGASSETTTGASSSTTTGAGVWYSDPGFTSGFSVTSTDGYHTHDGEVTGGGNHTHALAGVNHSHSMPHTHNMPHTHEIPAHTHDIEFGIFEGPIASSITVKVDGNEIAGLGVNEGDVDIVPYLSVDESGRIERGQFHTIEISPNSLTRVKAAVVLQFFVQSRGGGNY